MRLFNVADRYGTDVVPFQPKQRDSDVADAIDAVIKADGAIRAHDAERRAQVNKRATAIEIALAKGATLDELAELLHVTRQRVRQMSRGM